MTAKFNTERFRELAAHEGDATLDDFARRTGIDFTVFSRLLNNKYLPRVSTLATIATTYGCSLDDLILRDPPENAA